MKTISKEQFIKTIQDLLLESNLKLDEKTELVLRKAKDIETNTLGKQILSQIVENTEVAWEEKLPMCQDTGMVVVFLEIGKVQMDFDVEAAVNEAVRSAYQEGYLRKSVLNHPVLRQNTKDNTPAILHVSLRNDDLLKITVAPKGGGAENMSQVAMLTPAEGRDGIVDFVLSTIKRAGGKACPPFVVGVGIGGNFEQVTLLAKKALMREIDDSSDVEFDQQLEQDLFEQINQLGIGPMGFGGNTTALAVKVNSYPCHIASLPVAVNIQCHSSRHRSVIL